MEASGGMIADLFAEILRDTHRYEPGIDHRRATLTDGSGPSRRTARSRLRERSRDLAERIAGRAGFSHRHFDPSLAGQRLARVAELTSGLEATYARLGDDQSRRAMRDVLKLRVLGPEHSSLAVSPQEFRARQAQADERLRTRRGTFEVSDPWFSPLSLYSIPLNGGGPVALHAHSVDVVSVFLLGQYSYSRGTARVTAEARDVVLDVGGCWGDTALYFASLAGPDGRVYSFEFDPESLEVFGANLALNPELAPRIEVVERALWDRPGETISFTQAGRMTKVGADGGGLTVTTTTVDEFVSDAGLERVDFVKLDVEGAELHVLGGAAETIRRFAPKLSIAAYHKDDDLVRIPEAIASIDPEYRFYVQTASPVEEETVLFAASPRATAVSSRT